MSNSAIDRFTVEYRLSCCYAYCTAAEIWYL